ncbi:MAG: hypothetical protein ABSD80_05810 [Caulobacteraceae bacterium]|jgi:hypothetical protein
MRPALLIVLASGVALAACDKQIDAPTQAGVCWKMERPPNAPPKFNALASGVPDLEHCAAQLESNRIRVQSLGLPQTEATGAYQGQFLFIDRRGVFTAQTYKGYQYPFMVRTGDGRLAVPGAMPQGQ